MTGPFFVALDLRLMRSPLLGPSLEEDACWDFLEGPAFLFFMVRVREGGMIAVDFVGDDECWETGLNVVGCWWWSDGIVDGLALGIFLLSFGEGR